MTHGSHLAMAASGERRRWAATGAGLWLTRAEGLVAVAGPVADMPIAD
jgi:hypothetical protein